MEEPIILSDFRKPETDKIAKKQNFDCKTAIKAAKERGAAICREDWANMGGAPAFLYWQDDQSLSTARFGTTIAGLVAFRSNTKTITIAGGLCAVWWPDDVKLPPIVGQNFTPYPQDALATDWIIIEQKNVFEGAA